MTTPEIGTTIDAAGIATNIHLAGDDAAPPVLLLHGSGPGVTAWANWRLTLPELSRRFRVVAPDIVGFGFTQRPADVTYDLDTWTAHAIGVLDALGIERAHVVGNSFGGSLAMSIAIRHPDRVSRLVLMGSVGVPFAITPGLDAVWGYEPSVEAMEGLLHLFAYDRDLIGPDLARLRYEASVRPGVQEAYRAMFPAPRQRALDAMTHSVDEIAAITAPTLVVHGREDLVIPLQNAFDLLGLIDEAQLHVFGHCGHWTQIEHAAAFTELVTDFLLAGTSDAVQV
jgi:2-hydroxymuconate-semialdehyde hydrolase